MTAIVAHRGDSSVHRENTLEAIRSAIVAGADTIEIDVRLTRDGEVVLLHDATLNRLWGIDANIADLTLAEVEKLGGGELRIPLLRDALHLMHGETPLLLIDMDSSEPAAAAHRVVATSGSTARVAWCGHIDAMKMIRRRDAAAEIWMPWGEASAPTALDLAELRPAFVNLPHVYVGRALVAAIHSLGVRVSCWTVDDTEQMAWLLSIGVDSITSNQLALLLCLRDNDAAATVQMLPRARLIARELASWAVEYVRKHHVTTVATKANPADHVTEIDLAIERVVRAVIGAQFSDHCFVGEEFGGEAQADKPCWYLDPVDGTANLANGMPWTSFSLALVMDGAPVVGVVADPWRGVVVEAEAGGGAWAGGIRLCLNEPDAEALSAPTIGPAPDPLRGAMVSTELAAHAAWPGMLPMLEALSQRYCTMRIMGSGTLTVAGIALGHGIGAVIGRFGPVDHLAAVLIVREAGGVVLDESGDDTLFPASGGVLAAANRQTAEQLHTLWREAITQ
ncbi:inositol monophosphatase family protein [Agreia bicolorata]|nr:inositol monophosphatase family protein [Agreia bicolorata]